MIVTKFNILFFTFSSCLTICDAGDDYHDFLNKFSVYQKRNGLISDPEYIDEGLLSGFLVKGRKRDLRMLRIAGFPRYSDIEQCFGRIFYQNLCLQRLLIFLLSRFDTQFAQALTPNR